MVYIPGAVDLQTNRQADSTEADDIWVDKETGINYLYYASGYSGGLTPLLDREGKPVISSIVNS